MCVSLMSSALSSTSESTSQRRARISAHLDVTIRFFVRGISGGARICVLPAISSAIGVSGARSREMILDMVESHDINLRVLHEGKVLS